MSDPHNMMLECVNLALAGKGYTGTNPVVGAMVVKNGEILGRGFHKSFGGAHAEIEAINNCSQEINGADLYVTLEPCSHYGKTPPCVETIVKSGISRVFIGVVDPNPLNAGNGINYLLNNGIEVYVGFAEQACAEIIEDFAKYILKGQPFYSLKIAQSLDGKIATYTGASKWITDETSRQYGHYFRSISDGILVGKGTVDADNPMLSSRFMGIMRYPYKIILDSSLSISEGSAVFEEKPERCIIFVSNSAIGKNKNKADNLMSKGVDIVPVNSDEYGLNLHDISSVLIGKNILNVLVEGGRKIYASFINNKLADKCYFFTSGKIIGEEGVDSIGKLGIDNIEESVKLEELTVQKLKNDFLFNGKINDYTEHILKLTEELRNRCSQG